MLVVCRGYLSKLDCLSTSVARHKAWCFTYEIGLFADFNRYNTVMYREPTITLLQNFTEFNYKTNTRAFALLYNDF